MLRIYAVYTVTVFAVVTLTALAAVTVLPRLVWRRRAARTAARLILLGSGIPLTVKNADTLPAKPSIVVANHASYIDGVVLCAVLPPRFTFVIKREVTQAPFVHFLLRRIGSHFVERSDRHRGASDTRTLLRTASDGGSLAIFPEGTFIRKAGLQRFHSGAFAAAVAGRLPVVPIIIKGSRGILPAKEHWPRPGRLAVTVYPAIACEASGRPEIERLSELSRRVMLRHLDEPDLTSTTGKNQPAETTAPARQAGAGDN